MLRELKLTHVQAAIDVEDLAGDVCGLVAGEKNHGGGDFAVGSKAAERNHGPHFVFQFLRKRIGHRRFDESRRDGVHGNRARGDFDCNGAREAD